MTRTLMGLLRLVTGLGAIVFFSFAVAATVLVFYAFEDYTLVWDINGPCWQFGGIAFPCYFAALFWLLLWHALPSLRPGVAKEHAPERTHPPVGATGLATALLNVIP